jgi:DNA-binding transcriptional LysR family regulator
MNLAGVDLNLFVVFDTIYTERSLTGASEILHITQPAVSNALARLRVAFNDPLFVRVGRSMMPSPLAQNLIGPVRASLRQLRATIDQGRKFDAATSQKTFSISMRDTGTQILPRLLGHLARSAPGVRIHCPPVDRRDLAGELASGQLDLAVDIPELARSDLKSVKLLDDRYVCVMRRGHPLASRKLTLERFLSAKHILVSGRRSGRGYIDVTLGRLGHQVDNVLRLTHFQPAFHVVGETDMLLTAPSSLAHKYDVVVKDLPFPAAPLEGVLYWHRNADQDPGNVWIREEFIRAARMG